MTAASPRGAPAKFNPADQRCRSLIGKVHVGKTQLRMIEDDYRAMLVRITSHSSAKDCTEAQLVAVIEEMKAKGFAAQPTKPSLRRADHPSARKARSLWISLHQLGAIDNPTEAALEAFARRQLGVDRLQWANQAQCYKLIEALKAVAGRHGWNQSTDGVSPRAVAVVLKRRLVEAILDRLKAAEIAPKEWGAVRAAFEFGGITLPGFLLASESELELTAQALGRVLRDAVGTTA